MIFNFLLLLLFSIDYQTDRKSQTTNNSGQGPKALSLMRARQVSSPANKVGWFRANDRKPPRSSTSTQELGLYGLSPRSKLTSKIHLWRSSCSKIKYNQWSLQEIIHYYNRTDTKSLMHILVILNIGKILLESFFFTIFAFVAL